VRDHRETGREAEQDTLPVDGAAGGTMQLQDNLTTHGIIIDQIPMRCARGIRSHPRIAMDIDAQRYPLSDRMRSRIGHR
jgi:hypothetical protein